jgi:hypothetical protein
MFAARGSLAPIAIEPVRVQVIRFEITIYAFASRACGASAGGRFDHHQRRLVLLRHLRRRQPGLLQRGVLAEQSFL